MGWQQELSKPLNDQSEVITGPLVRILGPVETGLGGSYELDYDFEFDQRRTVSEVIGTLTAREERVLRLKFGIGTSECTYDEIAEQFSVTRERIRQIEAKALRKLKHPTRSRILRSLVDDGKESPRIKASSRPPVRIKEAAPPETATPKLVIRIKPVPVFPPTGQYFIRFQGKFVPVTVHRWDWVRNAENFLPGFVGFFDYEGQVFKGPQRGFHSTEALAA